MPTTTRANAYDVLADRGMVADCTDENIRERLGRPVVVYNGFDPSADSLGVGNLVAIMGLAHFQRCGHKPIALIGGATGLVGDPSGKTEARKVLSREQVEHNAACIGEQIGRIIRMDDSDTGGVRVNNADWLSPVSWIDMLRDIGPHFSINRMLSMESVKGRIDGGGISFLEFSYMIMQAYDFVHLHREFDCTVQVGGQDQWGNIVMGVDLARRLDGAELAGLTYPLLLQADGNKFGKSEKGNVWLDPERTSPYEFYQFWRNANDADVGKLLRTFTFLPMDEVRQLESREGAALNEAKETLAFEVTKLVHGEAEAARARDDSRKAFGDQKDATGEAIPHASATMDDIDGQTVPALLVRAGLAASGGEAKRLIRNGGVKLGDQAVDDITRTVTTADVTDGHLILRVGRRKLFRFDIS